MRVVVHIGPHKTGTSALQAFLDMNHDGLRSRGVWYRGAEGSTNHTPLVARFLADRPEASVGLQAYLVEAAASKCHLCVVSSELFSKRTLDLHAVLGVLAGYDVTVIAYLRRPDDRKLSVFDQIVRQSAHTKAIGELQRVGAPYRQNIGRWATALGDRFVLAPYDPGQWPNGSIFDDFLTMLSVDGAELDHKVAASAENRSLPAALTEVLRRANIAGLSGETRNAFIAELYQLQAERPDLYAGDLLTNEQRRGLRQELLDDLDFWRPHFRAGFDAAYLNPPDGIC